jgi:hypothetical protein
MMTKPDGSSRHTCKFEALKARQENAALREKARARRSSEEQLALLDGRPGQSRRERARLA